MRVMLLGWNKLFTNRDSTAISCINPAEALAKWVNVSLILPQSEWRTTQKNIQITGLNHIRLRAISANNPKPETFPFADQNIAPAMIPLYGTPVYTGQGIDQIRQKFSGEAITTGTFTEETNLNSPEQGTKLNLFNPEQFNQLSLSSQIIQYARYASHYASQSSFDLIYAYDLPAFLAGTELKLRTGKKLVVQVSGLSYMPASHKNEGWLYEIEKYTLEKAEVVISESKIVRAALIEKYDLNQKKIITLETKVTKTTTEKTGNSPASTPGNNEIEPATIYKQDFLNQVTGEILETLLSLNITEQPEEVKKEKSESESILVYNLA
ncbi:glycosyltransferase family 4 protein [Adhaeribacter rhizoryzae]|uniref:Uncharacterized protein n=1 Tax=Adhaeribacter rhizoryzae TaxID=2607907 RepID=A0A5M6CZV5_9BACT|nr:glycosyltransferase [Adhaeribacter rhizoryzae]KAA5539960.1 hypothetical protein F0145_23515 [Adhaeribacter rhizoryzae]